MSPSLLFTQPITNLVWNRCRSAPNIKMDKATGERSDSGERCEVKKAMKSRGGLAFIFSRSFLLRTAPHYLNAWNKPAGVTFWKGFYSKKVYKKGKSMSRSTIFQ